MFLNIKKKRINLPFVMWEEAITHMRVLWMCFLEFEFISKSVILPIQLLNRMSAS